MTNAPSHPVPKPKPDSAMQTQSNRFVPSFVLDPFISPGLFRSGTGRFPDSNSALLLSTLSQPNRMTVPQNDATSGIQKTNALIISNLAIGTTLA